MLTPPSISRRQLLRTGATGAAAIAVGAQWTLLEGVASAAPLSASLRRSTWNALHDPTITATSGAQHVALQLVRVADLPVAETFAGLRGRDDAFLLEFSGPAGLPQGTVTLASAELGSATLFLVPVGLADGAGQRYDAVVDRTIRIAGINEEGAPSPVAAPAFRAGSPSTPAATAASAAGGAPVARRATVRTPALRRVTVRRGRSSRRLAADLTLAQTRDVVGVRAVLLRGDIIVAKAFSAKRAPHQLTLRFTAGSPPAARRHTLLVRLIARDGTVTSVRRSVTLD